MSLKQKQSQVLLMQNIEAEEVFIQQIVNLMGKLHVYI